MKYFRIVGNIIWDTKFNVYNKYIILNKNKLYHLKYCKP